MKKTITLIGILIMSLLLTSCSLSEVIIDYLNSQTTKSIQQETNVADSSTHSYKLAISDINIVDETDSSSISIQFTNSDYYELGKSFLDSITYNSEYHTLDFYSSSFYYDPDLIMFDTFKLPDFFASNLVDDIYVSVVWGQDHSKSFAIKFKKNITYTIDTIEESNLIKINVRVNNQLSGNKYVVRTISQSKRLTIQTVYQILCDSSLIETINTFLKDDEGYFTSIGAFKTFEQADQFKSEIIETITKDGRVDKEDIQNKLIIEELNQ